MVHGNAKRKEDSEIFSQVGQDPLMHVAMSRNQKHFISRAFCDNPFRN